MTEASPSSIERVVVRGNGLGRRDSSNGKHLSPFHLVNVMQHALGLEGNIAKRYSGCRERTDQHLERNGVSIPLVALHACEHDVVEIPAAEAIGLWKCEAACVIVLELNV